MKTLKVQSCSKFHAGVIFVSMSKTTTKDYKCAGCETALSYPFWRVRKRLENGIPIRCKSCAQKNAAKNWSPEAKVAIQAGRKKAAKKLHSAPKSVRIKRARKAGQGNRKNNGLSVRRQWESIKNKPEEYRQACERLRQTALDFHASMSDEEKVLYHTKVFKNTGTSKVCEDFLSILESEFGLQVLREEAIAGFIVDGLVSDKGLILEFYGDMFHCNPLKFQDPDEYCSWISRTVGQQWKRDKRRLAALFKNGYKVLIVWEYDWNNNREEVLERVRNALC